MNHIMRLQRALRRHWLAILIGFATGLYVAFALCLALMIIDVSRNWEANDTMLATVMQAILMVGMVGGGFLGYLRRR